MPVQYTALAGTAETTIVVAPDAGGRHSLQRLIITTPNAAASVLTLRDSAAGAIRGKFDYPNAAVAPNGPLVVDYTSVADALTQSARGAVITLQASVNASGYNVTAVYNED